MTDRTRPHVVIALVNWNGWPDLLECLESVLRLAYDNYSIVICDNASTDGSVDRLRAWCAGDLEAPRALDAMARHSTPPVAKPLPLHVRPMSDAPAQNGKITLIEAPENMGFAAGCNVGLRHALAVGAEYTWLLNTDTVVEKDALNALVSRAEGDERIGLCGSTLLYYDAPHLMQEAGGCAYYPWLGVARRLNAEHPANAPIDPARVERQLGYVSGASCLVSKGFLRDVGPMVEDHFLYGEEIDWALRMKDQFPGKYRLGFAQTSVVYHKKGRATGSKSAQSGRSAASHYYLWRSRRRIADRHRPLARGPLLLMGYGSALVRRMRGDAAGARAILDGVRDRDWRAES